MGRARHYAGKIYRSFRPKRGNLDPSAPAWANSTASKFPRYKIGPHTYGAEIEVYHAAGDTLEIGDYCSLAGGTAFWIGGEHRPDWITTFPFNTIYPQFAGITGHPTGRGDIIVGSDVWTGWQSAIMSGVTIGHGAVIATRSLVVKDVEPYTIVGGVPAKPIRKRFDEATIARLLEIAWWDWDEESVFAAVPFLQSDNMEGFFAEVDAGRLPLKK